MWGQAKPESVSVEKLIRKLKQYGPVSEEERRVLENAVSHIDEYGPHQDFVHQGECPTESCLIMQGFASRYRLLPDGSRQIMALHIPGDFCDLHSFVLKCMDHGIATISACRIAKIPHSVIKEITERYPRLARAFWWDTAIDAAIMREWLVSVGRRSAYERVSHLLCELYLRTQSVGLLENNGFDLPVTQAELGDAFGLSTVHVNRTLQELRRAGLVIFTGKRVTIPDFQRLKEAAGFDPAYLHVRGAPGAPKA